MLPPTPHVQLVPFVSWSLPHIYCISHYPQIPNGPPSASSECAVTGLFRLISHHNNYVTHNARHLLLKQRVLQSGSYFWILALICAKVWSGRKLAKQGRYQQIRIKHQTEEIEQQDILWKNCISTPPIAIKDLMRYKQLSQLIKKTD